MGHFGLKAAAVRKVDSYTRLEVWEREQYLVFFDLS